MAQKSPETKLIKFLRVFLSFVLSIIIAVLSIGICFSVDFLDSSKLEKYFTCYEYTEGVRTNVLTYTKGLYLKNGLHDDNLDTIISYNSVQSVTDNYAGHYVSARVGFDDDAYQKSIDEITENIRADITAQISATNQNENTEALNKITNSINNYFNEAVTIKGAEHIETLLNIGVPAGYAVIGVCAFFFVFIALILYFLGEKRYRSLRAISISFFTAGLFEICLACIVLIISQIRKFDIYPVYLYNQFMEYVYNGIGAVVVTGCVTVVIGIAVAALTWINKVKGKR